jgi:hypothetical protein
MNWLRNPPHMRTKAGNTYMNAGGEFTWILRLRYPLIHHILGKEGTVRNGGKRRPEPCKVSERYPTYIEGRPLLPEKKLGYWAIFPQET